MASHQQIQQNFNDINNAWGQMQNFINYVLPAVNGNMSTYINYLNTRRRFR